MENSIHILCISDIHYSKSAPENQGLVLREFFNDLPKQLIGIDRDNLYCIIAGDLVQAGNVDKSYDDFYEAFIKKLTLYIPLDHILCVAGNHDMNRNILKDKEWADKHNALFKKDLSEEEYNCYLAKNEESVIYKKFDCFNRFCLNKMQIENYDLLGYSVNLVPEISVFCLNSALLSNGGAEGFPKDEGRLRVETSKLYEWAANNVGRTKILAMHHPLNHLSEYIRSEIENILRKDVQILLTGHLHKKDFRRYMGVEDELCKYCSSPQLFSDKHDQNGYSIMHFKGSFLESIEYRKWSTIDEEFSFGSEFSRTENGKIIFTDNNERQVDDLISKELSLRLNESLRLYNYTPSWVNRTLSDIPPSNKNTGEETRWDHVDVINSNDNLQIVGGSQFGLTTFAHKLVLEAWTIKRQQWLYIDVEDLRPFNIQSKIDDFCANRNIDRKEIPTVIIDNWNKVKSQSAAIKGKLSDWFPEARMILIHNEEDSLFFSGLDEAKYEDGFSVMYLRELNRNAIRSITKEFIARNNFRIEDDDKIFERLLLGLMDLNVHRTPVNCLQLLLNFQQNYESRPINRAKVLSSLLKFFFLKPDSFFYTESLDEDDCCIIMGALCEYLLKNRTEVSYRRTFTIEEYLKATNTISQRQYSVDERNTLLQSMIEAQIVVPYMQSYEFRFSYWVYYFAAHQMYSSKEFYNYMLDTQRAIFMPDLMEFYTGIDSKCDDIIEVITLELNEISNSVSSNLGVSISNPYKTLKCRPNPTLENRTKEQLEEDIMASKLPVDVKDALADENYDNSRPYSQTIETVLDHFQVRNLMNLSRSASRAFRNSNLVDEKKRNLLYEAILKSWYSVFEVVLLLAPALAINGKGTMGGASFALNDNLFKDDPQKRLINVIVCIPYNIVNWFKNDVYSEKRINNYINAVENENTHEITKHINVLLLIMSRPKGWKDLVKIYIKDLKSNSYYLGNTLDVLGHCYQMEYMSKNDQTSTRSLIMDCLMKQKASFKQSHDQLKHSIPRRLINE